MVRPREAVAGEVAGVLDRDNIAHSAISKGAASIELDREDDGRWIAEALELPGVMAYGQTREEAISNTERLCN